MILVTHVFVTRSAFMAGLAGGCQIRFRSGSTVSEWFQMMNVVPYLLFRVLWLGTEHALVSVTGFYFLADREPVWPVSISLDFGNARLSFVEVHSWSLVST